jgi:hypothetical protein
MLVRFLQGRVYDGSPRFAGMVCEVDNNQAAIWLADNIVDVPAPPTPTSPKTQRHTGGK